MHAHAEREADEQDHERLDHRRQARPDDLREHYMQPEAGHYGVFNGSRFRWEILPKMQAFVAAHQGRRGLISRALEGLIA